MDGCCGSTGLPGFCSSSPTTRATVEADSAIKSGSGVVVKQGLQAKEKKDKVNPPPEAVALSLIEMPEDLLYAIGQLLKPESALALDVVLRDARKPIYTVQDRKYLLLLKQLQLFKHDGKVLLDLYKEAGRLLCHVPVYSGRKELVFDLMQFLLRLPQEKAWPAAEADLAEVCFKDTSQSDLIALFTTLSQVHADKCLRLMIQGLPRERAVAVALQVFQTFSNEDVEMFIEAAYQHGTTPLWAATVNGRIDLVTHLVAMKADVNAQNAHGISVVSYAASLGYKAIVQILLNCPELDPNIKDKTDCSALYWASYQEQIETALLLSGDSRTDPNAYSAHYNFSALHLALIKGHANLAEALLEKAELNPTLEDKIGRTGLHWAQVQGYHEIADKLSKCEAHWRLMHP